jgi:hypothetical protein
MRVVMQVSARCCRAAPPAGRLEARPAAAARTCTAPCAAGARSRLRRCPLVPARAAADEPQPPPKRAEAPRPLLDSLGLSLGPIGMTLGGGRPPAEPQAKGEEGSLGSRLAGAAGVSLGPIALSLGASVRDGAPRAADADDADAAAAAEAVRLNSLSSQEWQQTFVRPGAPAPRTSPAARRA